MKQMLSRIVFLIVIGLNGSSIFSMSAGGDGGTGAGGAPEQPEQINAQLEAALRKFLQGHRLQKE